MWGSGGIEMGGRFKKLVGEISLGVVSMFRITHVGMMEIWC